MNKTLLIIVVGIFLGLNPLVVKFSYAGLTDMFKNDFEYCMAKVYEEDKDLFFSGGQAYAAKLCAGVSSGVKSCMKKVYEEDGDWAYAARACTGN